MPSDQTTALATPRDAIARAMFGHFFGGTSDPSLTDMAESMATSLADQAILALRDAGFEPLPTEPTEAMVHAAAGRANQATEESMYHGIWRAMVRAARG